MILNLIIAFSLQIIFPTAEQKNPTFIFNQLLQDLPSFYFEGRPNIPVKPSSLPVKGFRGIEVKPLERESLKVDGLIPPSIPPQILSLSTVKKEAPFDTTFYKGKAFYPDSYYTYRLVHSGSDTTLELQLFPLRYNPGDSLVEYITKFIVTVDGEVAKQDSFQPLYLVIAPQDFRNTLAPLIKLRKQKGYFVQFKSLEEIYSHYQGRNNAEKIRNFLKTYAGSEREKFLLLVGDETVIPIVYLYAFDCEAGFAPNENNIPSDLYYADINGDYDANGNSVYGEVADSVELYPDFYVGRLPVRDTLELQRYLYKLLNYEMLPDTASLHKAIFLAQILWKVPYTDQSVHKEYIRKRFLPADFTVKGFYESYGNAVKTNIIRALNDGANLVNHDGHGWYTGMWFGSDYIGISDAQDLNNIYAPFFLYSIGCWVGALDYNSLAEELIKVRGGAIGVVANSRYGWGAPGNPGFGYSDLFDNEFFKLLFRDKDDELGKVFWNHKAGFAPLARDTNVYRWCYYEINLLGDPALYPWRGVPKDFDIFSKDVKRGSIKLSVGYEGLPLSGVMATLMVGDSVLSIQKSDISGIISFNVDTLYDSVLLTLWKPGFNLYWEWIPLKEKNVVFNVKIKGDSGFRDWVKAGENNVVSIFVFNKGQSEFVDTIKLSSKGLAFAPNRIPVDVPPGESLSFDVVCTVPESLKTNTIKVLEISSRIGRGSYPLKITWPSVYFASYTVEDSLLLLRFQNNSFMDLKGRVLGVFELPGLLPLRFYSDSILAKSGTEFALKTDIPDSKNLRVFLDFGGTYLQLSIALAFDSALFSSDFETLSGWSGDTSYFCLSDSAGPYGKYLTYKREYAPFPLQARLFSRRFRLKGKFNLGLWFTYRFPTYGTTGIKISLLKEWFRGGAVYRREIQDVVFLGAGGALNEKSIYGNWAYYEYEGEIDDDPDSVRLLINFTKDSSSETYWGLDNLRVKSVNNNSFSKEEIAFEGVKVLNFPNILRGETLKLLALSKSSGILTVELFDAGGRKVKGYNLALKEGLNEWILPLSGVKSGVYFVRILNSTKRVVIAK